MTLEVVPSALYSLSNVKAILADGNSSILHKTLTADLENKAIYVTTPLIVCIRQGKQLIRDSDGSAHCVDEHHLIFLNKGVYTVSDYVTVGGAFEALLLFFDDALIARYCARFAGDDAPAPPPSAPGTYLLKADAQIQHYMDSLNHVYGDAQGSHALLELKLLELLHLIALQDKSSRFVGVLAGAGGARRRPIGDFMEQYYSHKLKIDDYAALSGRSASSFQRDFKRNYGTTPMRWLQERKVAIAHQLLVSKNYSVTDAAAEVGYENTSRFIKAYKLRYGITPGQARAQAGQP
ncbi:MAG: AraC family transcriptional regulator [Massilia sp.]